ncbi:helix-turn-helix transcriptional regulator [Streptomyces sp. NPDC048202]|uniref:helix-turn-helix transcriptional regulator n=1 Tax=Streptomyces sp. NPDC048202 TaxID=3365514 RepID=UPI003719A4E2
MRAARLIRMALLVQSSPGLTAEALARELDVSRRTVIRDAQALQEAGVPIRAERGRAGGYHLAPGHRTRLTTLHPTEAETLYLSGLPTALRDLGLSDAADTARLKLSATLLPSLRAAAESSVRRFHLDAPAWFREPSTPALLPELARAVWSDRTVRISYARPGRDDAVTRLLQPYGLVLKAGVWYVVGRVPAGRDGAWRMYRVDRVTALSLTEDEPFVRDPGFDLTAYWQENAARFARTLLRTTATLRLTERGLRRLAAVADPAGVTEALASASTQDADGRSTLELPVESEEVAFAQLSELGADVEVLAPEGLRERFRAHARALAALYGVTPGQR